MFGPTLTPADLIIEQDEIEGEASDEEGEPANDQQFTPVRAFQI